MSALISQVVSNPLVRLNGVHQSAKTVLHIASDLNDLPIEIGPTSEPSFDNLLVDYTYVDPNLDIVKPIIPDHVQPPRPGLGYAGFTPKQRYLFLEWLCNPRRRAPEAFLRLYLAYQEVNLLERQQEGKHIHEAIALLQSTLAWKKNEYVARTLLLSYWLNQDRLGLAEWIARGKTPASLLGLALGQQMILQKALNVDQLTVLVAEWGHVATPLPNAKPSVAYPKEGKGMWASRLAFLNTYLGEEILAYASHQLPPDVAQPKPWRCAHRDIRIALPQPDIQPILKPLLVELLSMQDIEREIEANTEMDTQVEVDGKAPRIGWHLVLEFGHSRSEYFETVLYRVKRMPGFSQLMDENRKLVYRVLFKNGHMYRFWPIWELVKNWSHTRVYINGQELADKRNLYPQSPYLIN